MIVLTLLTVIVLPAPSAMAAEGDYAATIEQQIRAYADSIDLNDAANKAAGQMASHGMFKKGKTLNATESHPLTATLMNSELMQTALTDICTEAIRNMQQLSITSMPYIYGYIQYYGADSEYYARVYTNEIDYGAHTGGPYANYTIVPYTNPVLNRNDYDDSLEWIAGNTGYQLSVERTAVSDTQATYRVTCTILDRFDFDTSNSSGFKKLITGFGAAMFTEYDWTATASFELTVPYHCSHSSGTYRWTYDAEAKTLTPDVTNGWMENATQRIAYTNSSIVSYSHELEHPIRLCHDKPWVMEADLRSFTTLALSPVEIETGRTYPTFLLSPEWVRTWTKSRDWATDAFFKEHHLSSRVIHSHYYYSADLAALYQYSSQNTYTYRLENIVEPNGSNMIWVSVLDAETGECLVEKQSMDNYYRWDSWEKVDNLLNENDDTLSGKDLYIAYIGNESYRLNASHFELRVWENGEGNPGEKLGVLQSTENGVSTYLCPLCGGTYEEAVRLPGDINGDGEVNNKDATRLFQYLSGWEVEVEEDVLDVNGDGEVNNKDATRLFQHLSGWDVEIF